MTCARLTSADAEADRAKAILFDTCLTIGPGLYEPATLHSETVKSYKNALGFQVGTGLRAQVHGFF